MDRVRIRPSGVSWREVDGEIIALDIDSSAYFTTNRSGTLLWHALIGGATEPQMIELLQEAYEIEGEAAAADVSSFVGLLRAHGLVDTTD